MSDSVIYSQLLNIQKEISEHNLNYQSSLQQFFHRVPEILEKEIFGLYDQKGLMTSTYESCMNSGSDKNLNTLISLLQAPAKQGKKYFFQNQQKPENNLFQLFYEDALKKHFKFKQKFLPQNIKIQIENQNFQQSNELLSFRNYFHFDKQIQNSDLHLRPMEYLIFLLCIGASNFKPTVPQQTNYDLAGFKTVDTLAFQLKFNPYLILIKQYLEFFRSEKDNNLKDFKYYEKLTFLLQQYIIKDNLSSQNKENQNQFYAPQQSTMSKSNNVFLNNSQQIYQHQLQFSQQQQQLYQNNQLNTPAHKQNFSMNNNNYQQIQSSNRQSSGNYAIKTPKSHYFQIIFLLIFYSKNQQNQSLFYDNLLDQVFKFINQCLGRWNQIEGNQCNIDDLGRVWLYSIRMHSKEEDAMMQDLNLGKLSDNYLIYNSQNFENVSSYKEDVYFIEKNKLIIQEINKKLLIAMSTIQCVGIRELHFINCFLNFNSRFVQERKLSQNNKISSRQSLLKEQNCLDISLNLKNLASQKKTQIEKFKMFNETPDKQQQIQQSFVGMMDFGFQEQTLGKKIYDNISLQFQKIEGNIKSSIEQKKYFDNQHYNQLKLIKQNIEQQLMQAFDFKIEKQEKLQNQQHNNNNNFDSYGVRDKRRSVKKNKIVLDWTQAMSEFENLFLFNLFWQVSLFIDYLQGMMREDDNQQEVELKRGLRKQGTVYPKSIFLRRFVRCDTFILITIMIILAYLLFYSFLH